MPASACSSFVMPFVVTSLWRVLMGALRGALQYACRCTQHRGRAVRGARHHYGRRQHFTYNRILRLCFFFICLGDVVMQLANATLVASSRISYCTNSGDEVLNCTKKMVVTLTVEAGQQADEESLVFVNSALDDTTATGSANTTTGTTAPAKTVNFSPISITTSRSAVRYRYPLFYVQNYNAKPYEATVKGKLLNQCNADFNPLTATCGVAYDTNGKAIPFSQGFCCDCSMCQTLGFCEPDARANKACNIFDEYTTASCLRFGQRWYSGYTIGTYVTWFTLNVTVARNTIAAPPNGANTGVAAAVARETVVLQLSPSVLGDTANGGWSASARLVGSFAPTDQPLDLTSHMLFAPALPPTDERVSAGAAEWMLLPNTLVTHDGRECNKIGVSYEAFASQGNKCNLNPGSCLSSQLEDYRSSDLARVAAGKKAQYMATGYGDFELERVANASNSGWTSPYISYIATSPAATMVVLAVNADGLEYIVGVANGKILSATLNKVTMEAGTRDGALTVVVQNVAMVTGRLAVSVQNCTNNVFPIAAQILSLAAQQQSSLTFNVYVQNTATPGSANCTVVVRNAEEVVTDAHVVSWAVTATGFNNGTQGGTAGNNGSGSSKGESSAVKCSACGTLNIVCAVQPRCWGLVLLDLVVYFIIAAVVLCVFWFRRTFCCCLYKKQCYHYHSRSPRLDCSEGRSRSPIQDDYGTGRRSRSRKVILGSTGSNGLPRSSSMTYAAAPVYALPAIHYNNGIYASSTSPFASPLRVQPSSSLPLSPSPPPLPHACHGVATPNHQLSPVFHPSLSGDFAASLAVSPSPSPAASYQERGQQRLHSPMSSSPFTPSFYARGARSDYGAAMCSAHQWRSCCGEDGCGGAFMLRGSHHSTPAPSVIHGGHAPYT